MLQKCYYHHPNKVFIISMLHRKKSYSGSSGSRNEKLCWGESPFVTAWKNLPVLVVFPYL